VKNIEKHLKENRGQSTPNTLILRNLKHCLIGEHISQSVGHNLYKLHFYRFLILFLTKVSTNTSNA